MRPRLAFLPGAAAALLFALAIIGCGNGSHISAIQEVEADCGNVQYGGEGNASKLIVSDLPLKGDSAERSRQMNYAILQVLTSKGWQAGPGIELAFQACDDSLGSTGEWDQALCRSNAQAYSSNPDVIGVIGTYNSGCAAAQISILNRAPGGGVAMVSPGNTLVCLTEPSPTLCAADEPGVFYPTGKRNYARVVGAPARPGGGGGAVAPGPGRPPPHRGVANDAVQGAGLASFARSQGITDPYVLFAAGDPTSEGQAQAFARSAFQLGMRVSGIESWDPGASSYLSLLQHVRRRRSDAVVLAGLLEQNGVQLIRDKETALGPNDGPVKLLAFDGFAQQATIDNTGLGSKGIYVSLPGKVPGALAGQGQVVVEALRASITANPIEGSAPYTAQAAALLVQAIRRGGGTRTGTIAQLFQTRVEDGITGSFVITPSGDPEPAPPISVQRADRTFVLAQTINPPPQLVDVARGR